MRSPRWASRTRSRTRHDAGLAQNLRRAAGFPGRLYSTHVRSVPAIRFLEEGSHNVKMKPLISREDGARKTAMHELIIGKGGYSTMHRHEWDHQLVVTEGSGIVILDGKKFPLRPGVVFLVQSNEMHQFLQRGKDPLHFLTVTPL